MCGRFTLAIDDAFYTRFDILVRLDGLAPRFNIAPGQMVPVITAQSREQLTLMRWGLIPHWAKEEQTAYKMINARVESLTEKAAYRGLLAANRCLVPASGFFEWKQEGKGKTPYYIHPKAQPFVALAGLYDRWHSAEGKELLTFTIITTEAAGAVAALHQRMPVMLAPELEDNWLDEKITDPAALLELLSRSSPGRLETYPVSRMDNTPSVDDPSLIQPVTSATRE